MVSSASKETMELPRITVCIPSWCLEPSLLTSTASSTTTFRNISYPRSMPATFLDPFNCSKIFLSIYFFSSGVDTILIWCIGFGGYVYYSREILIKQRMIRLYERAVSLRISCYLVDTKHYIFKFQ